MTKTKELNAEILVSEPKFNPVAVLEKAKDEIMEFDTGKELSEEDSKKVQEFKSTINLEDTNSIITFGVQAQEPLTEQSQDMLKGVRNKDVGVIGDTLSGMMTNIRGLGIDSLDPDAKTGFLAKLFGAISPLQRFIQGFETVEAQVNSAMDMLTQESVIMERDIRSLDIKYEESLKLFHILALYIKAGEEALEDIRTVKIPDMQRNADSEKDESRQMIFQTKVNDASEAAMDLERQIHNLKVTRTVTMQTLPQIRMIQNTDKGLITKINSTKANVIPMWYNQISIAMTMWNQGRTAKALKTVDDTTNEMLMKGADMMKDSNAKARHAIERGIVDIETVNYVNEKLIETIQESVDISIEAQKARQLANADFARNEKELKEALRNASTATIKSA